MLERDPDALRLQHALFDVGHRGLLDITAYLYGIAVDDILGAGRDANVAEARQLVYYTLRRTGGWSYCRIGRVLGKDRSTVMHGVHATERRRGEAGYRWMHEEVARELLARQRSIAKLG